MSVTTYIVEDVFGNIIEYSKTLKHAKFVAKTYGGVRIYSMVGGYFGEGFHKLQWLLSTNDQWKRNKL